MKLKRILSALLGALALLTLASIAAPKTASAGCISSIQLIGNGPTCLVWAPDPPAGARVCTGLPAYNEMNLYTGANGTGYCITLTAHNDGAAGSNEPNAVADHWYAPSPITYIRVGSGASMQGYIYQGAAPNFGMGWALPAGWAGDVTSLGIHCVMARGY